MSFETVEGAKVELTIRKIIMTVICNYSIVIESTTDGLFMIKYHGARLEPLGRVFNVSNDEMLKIKLQLGLEN
jgi:hypothetical protein